MENLEITIEDLINFTNEEEKKKPKEKIIDKLLKKEHQEYLREVFYLTKINELIELQNENEEKIIQRFTHQKLYGMELSDIECLIEYYK